MANTAAQPIATNPAFRDLLETKRRQRAVTIRNASPKTSAPATGDLISIFAGSPGSAR